MHLKLTQYCKSTIIQFKKKELTRKENKKREMEQERMVLVPYRGNRRKHLTEAFSFCLDSTFGRLLPLSTSTYQPLLSAVRSEAHN